MSRRKLKGQLVYCTGCGQMVPSIQMAPVGTLKFGPKLAKACYKCRTATEEEQERRWYKLVTETGG